MSAQPFHVGCGLRTVRVEQVRVVMSAPGVWDSPAAWTVRGVWFRCAEHGLVEWNETSYDARHARQGAPAEAPLFKDVPAVRRVVKKPAA